MGLPNEVNSALIGAAAAAGGYEIEQSLRFDGSAYLNRTPASAGNRKTFTYSFWIKRAKLGAYQRVLGLYTGASFDGSLRVCNDTDSIGFESYVGSLQASLVTSSKYRDPSAWMHVVYSVDTAQVTASDRVKIYVNGQQVTSFSTATYPSQNADLAFNNNSAHYIGQSGYPSEYLDAYLAEFNFIDGTALDPTDFGEPDDNGVWRPIAYTGSHGTNGFYLTFDPSATNGIGHDHSGNGNNFSPTGFTTSGTGTDVMSDTPTTNWATFNPLVPGASSFSNGNLTVTANGSGSQNRGTPFPTIKLPDSGKWYAEFTPSSIGEIQIGLVQGTSTTGSVGDTVAGYYRLGTISVEGTGTVETVASFTNGDVIGVIVNADDQEIRFSKNGTIVTTQAWDYSSAPNSGNCYLSFKQGSSSGSCTAAANYGAQGFTHTPPTGYKPLNTSNLSAPTVKDGSQYFDTLTWTGDSSGASRTLSGLAFGPDLVWAKGRNQAISHQLTDIVRGAGATSLRTDDTRVEGADGTSSGYLSAFTSDGFETTSSSTNVYYNTNTYTYAAWCWDAGGSGSSNTDGSITSTVSANPDAGFSIATYTGNGTAGATIGHGLGVAPKMIIVKQRSGATDWQIGHQSIGWTKTLYFTTAAATTETGAWNNTAPTSTVFSVGTSRANTSSATYIAYCFAEVEGYSKFGSYTGNGSTDGPFVWCGFKPAWIMWKPTNYGSATDWVIRDATRDTYNVVSQYLLANSSNAEGTASEIDILSNGFKFRNNFAGNNSSGTTVVFAAFAEHPFGGDGVSPATAR